MGSGDSHLLNALRHHLHGGGGGGGSKDHEQQQQQHLDTAHVRKGWLAVMVGQEGEEQRRFVVPVAYLSHPLFMRLLKEAEDEYGFDHKGAIALPCHVEEFRCVQGLIDRDRLPRPHGGGGGGAHHKHLLRRRHHHHHHHVPLIPHDLVGCFRA